VKFFILVFLFSYNFFLPLNSVLSEKNFNDIERETYLDDKDYYLLGPGDKVEIKIFDAPELSGIYTISNGGFINLPLIGNIELNNMSIKEATNTLQNLYGNELLRPELFLSVVSSRPIKISIVGEIQKPGLYSLSESESTSLGQKSIKNVGLPTVVDAIQKAGGITQNTNLKEVLLRRKLSGSNNEYKQAKLDLLSLITRGEQSQNLFLFDGDIIILQKADEFNSQLIRDSKSNLSPEFISIYVIGRVNKPEKYKVKSNTPLIQALYQAGGPVKFSSNLSNVELVRINENGTITKKTVKINLKKPLSKKNNPPLMEGDIIRVKSNLYDNLTGGLRKITEPFGGILQAVTLFRLLDD